MEVAALKQVFPELLESASLGDQPRAKLQEMGVLARLEVLELKTEIELRLPPSLPEKVDGLTTEEEERLGRIIQLLTDVPRRRFAILPHILAIMKDPEACVLYFGPTVSDAQAMTFLLRDSGITAAFVGAGTRDSARRQIIREFRAREVRVICNCEVLTTDFDAPRGTHLVIARPTMSRLLWEQMVGRGLRGNAFGGTATCVVYDCVDNFIGEPEKVRGFTEYRKSWRTERGQL